MASTHAVAVSEFIDKVNKDYEAYHIAYENNFWSTKMNLKDSNSEDLVKTKAELDRFLGDKDLLEQTDAFLAAPESLTEDQKVVLDVFKRTFQTYIIRDPEALAMREKLLQLEADLATVRNRELSLGFTDADGKFVKASGVQLRNTMRTSENEGVRKSCYEGLRQVGPFVVERFCEIVKLRNALAKKLGFEDFYDMKVQQAEGFNKATLFAMLDSLEQRTKPIMERARTHLAETKGADALLPHNTSYYLSGEIARAKDPYFPFENAVDVWSRSFAALGITYRGATMRLDLCDRAGKYNNGFCHWPKVAWVSPKGFVPSETNFTSLATPGAVGSGHTAVSTLMHEAGHAAHFANVLQGSPLFSQERAPTSVAYAENQSMFLDSLVSDAAWMARYARDRDGAPVPWEILEKEIRETHEYEVFILRGMLSVPYFEKALYELPETDITPSNLLALADKVEVDIQGGLTGRPVFAVPHILADESSAYYHGYVLAEMAVHQTRAYFMGKYGFIVDNPAVGKDLAEVYWKPGNSRPFLELVKELTGSPLSADAWVEKLGEATEEVVKSEKKAYDEAISSGPKFASGAKVDLDMNVLLVHGDEVIADSREGGLAAACEVYKKWIAQLH